MYLHWQSLQVVREYLSRTQISQRQERVWFNLGTLFSADIMAAKLLDKNRNVFLLWELNTAKNK